MKPYIKLHFLMDERGVLTSLMLVLLIGATCR